MLSAAVHELHETVSVLFYVALKILFFLCQVEARKKKECKGKQEEELEEKNQKTNRRIGLILGRKSRCLFERNVTAKHTVAKTSRH